MWRVFSPPIEATSSPIENEPSVMKSAFAGEPSGWSVEEVLLFLKQKDPHLVPSIADLFRKHVMYLLTQLSCQMSSSVRVIF